MPSNNANPTEAFKQELLDGAKAQTSGALAQLLESYRSVLLAKARRKLAYQYIPGKSGNDVVQTVFAKAVKNFDKFRGTTCSEWEAWLESILINLIVDIKKMASKGVPAHSKGLVKERVSQQPSPSSQIRRTEAADRLRRLIVQMPEPYRAVVIQRYIEGIESFADIATSLGRKENTVRQQWLRGLRWLKEVEGIEGIT